MAGTGGLAAALAAVPARAATVTWTGAGGTSWTASSWSPAGGPGTADNAAFTDAGATNLPGDVTSVVNADRTIGGLSFTNGSTKFHTLDLGTRTLTVNGNVSFNLDQSALSTTTIRNGTLVANGAFATFNVGRGASGSASSVVDLSGLTAFSANVQDVHVGSSTAGAGNGTLSLSPSNAITAQRLFVGSANASSDTRGTLHLGASNTLNLNEWTIGKDNAAGTVDVAAGGALTLGSAAARTQLKMAAGSFDNNGSFASKIDLTGGSFNGFLSNLTVGQRDGGSGGGVSVGSFLAGNAGAVNIGAAGNTANVIVGRTTATNSTGGASGTVDFSGLSTLSANVNTLSLGTAAISGPASGAFKLAAASNVDALSVVVGANASGTSSLTLGRTSTSFLANSLTVGRNGSTGAVSAPAGATVNLGSAARRVDAYVGIGDAENNSTYTGTLDLSGTTSTLYFNNLYVGHRDGSGIATAFGVLTAGSAGSADIGAPGNTANFYVGRKASGLTQNGASAAVDFSGLSTLTASLNEFAVGVAPAGGSANGTVKLAASNAVSANSITVGDGGGGSSALTLGRTSNTIGTGSLTIARNTANASVTAPAGAVVTLGSAAQPTNLTVGVSDAITNDAWTGRLDLSGTAFNATLGNLTVGQKDGLGIGGAVGIVVGGAGGNVTLGSASPGHTANAYVGRNLNGANSSGFGSVDLSGLSTLTANLNTLAIGTSTAGSATGSFALPAVSNVDALNVVVGQTGGGTTSTLTLGRTSTTLLTDKLTAGVDYANATVTLPTGATLALGSPTRRVTVALGTGLTNTFTGYTGTLDFTGGTVVAYLDGVTIGGKDSPIPGDKNGRLLIGTQAGNYVEAGAVTLGAGGQSTGTLTLGGGTLIANSIAAAGGTPTFNWNGGKLSVGTYGTPAIPIPLNNAGTGTLAPGSAANPIGTTTVYGAFTQAVTGTTAIQIAGASAPNGNDLLAVNGTASLAGTLDLSLTNGFVPSTGQNFRVASWTGARTGTFGFVSPPKLPQNVAFSLDYASDPTQLTVRMVAPAAFNYTSAAAAGTFGTAGSWDANAVPGTTAATTITNNGATAKTVTVGTSTTVHRIALSGPGAPVTLEVPAGIKLGVANQIVVGTGASLSGAGQIIGDVSVAGGTVSPGGTSAAAPVGTLGITGDAAVATTAGVVLDLASPSSHDVLDVSGHLAVGGNLRVQAVGGFAPAAGDAFHVLQFGSASGSFDSITLPPLAAGLAWDTSALAATGDLSVVVPEPAGVATGGLLVAGLLARRRSRRRGRGLRS